MRKTKTNCCMENYAVELPLKFQLVLHFSKAWAAECKNTTMEMHSAIHIVD